jgi:uncharacterized cupin superfamily protein
MPEAPLEDAGSGLVPAGDGWYVVNARDAAWVTRPGFGARATFDASGPTLRSRPDLEPRHFEDVGYTLSVLQPGDRSTLYHAESKEESYLVLSGSCLLVVDGEERELRPWDFVHLPRGTPHAAVATGAEPCIVLMSGARGPDHDIRYLRSDVALAHGVGVERDTDSPAEAYAPYPHWQPERPELPF